LCFDCAANDPPVSQLRLVCEQCAREILEAHELSSR
jgi:hypothetical protein